MRALLLFLLACLPAAGQWGGPSFSVPLGSAAASGSSSLGATNLLTTNCVVTAEGDTNRIVITLAGYGAVNGTYKVNTAVVGLYTNVLGVFSITNQDGTYEGTILSNNTIQLYGGFNGRPYGPFDDDLGGGGALPNGVFDNATNCYSYSYGLEPRTNIIYINCGDTNFLAKISNCPNNTIIFVGPCPQGYVYDSWAWKTNGVATPLSLVNKTNVEIHGFGMPTFNSSATAFADGMCISNSSRITLRGIRLENQRYTNIAGMPSFFVVGQVSALRLFNSEHLLFENCEFVNWSCQGIFDTACNDEPGIKPSTNNVIIRNNRFDNIGSFIAGTVNSDGAGIQIAGSCRIENNRFDNCLFGIEPYTPSTNRIFDVLIRGNLIRNPLLEGIRNAVNTNNFNVCIENNVIEYDIGYNRGGSNFQTDTRAIYWNHGAGTTIRNNRIFNCPSEAIYCAGGGAPAQGDVLVEDNLIVNQTNAVSGAGGDAILFYGVAAPQKITIRNNEIRDCVYSAIKIQGANNVMIEGNRVFNANLLSLANNAAIIIGAFDTASSNVTARHNVIVDALGRGAFGIRVGETTGAGVRKIKALNNDISGVATALIRNVAGAECMVDGTWPLGPTNVTALVAGSYTNNVWDRVVHIPNGSARTNRLLNAALTNYFPWPITIIDSGKTASGTNVWVATVASQTINGGPSQTNITADGGSLTLVPDGAGNWRIVSAYP